MTKGQFEKIVAWQKETFPDATALSKIAHLKKELPELEEAIELEMAIKDGTISMSTLMEFADCFFLLFGSAAATGLDYETIVSAIEQKFEINKARKWGKPDENGVVEHIRE